MEQSIAKAPKKVLIITYYWPPSGGSGVQRWLKFAKYLPEFNWQPVVACPDQADYTVLDESLGDEIKHVEALKIPIWEPYSLYRKITGAKQGESYNVNTKKKKGLLKRFTHWVRANFFIPDPKIYWVNPAVRALKAYLVANQVDAIITTGPPHSVHLIGQALKKEFPNKPWIADIRDPWSNFDVHLQFGPSKSSIAKNKKYERKALEKADIVLATSPSMHENLEPFNLSKFSCITNGYDQEDFDQFYSDPIKNDRITILHTGVLTAVRNPSALWNAIAQKAKKDRNFKQKLQIKLIGNVAPEVINDLKKYKSLEGSWSITPWLAHDKLFAEYQQADLLLLCPNQTDNAKSQINGKLFEYLALKKPILHIGPYHADNTRIIDEAHAGITINPKDSIGAAYALDQLLSSKFLSSPYAMNSKIIERFERKATTNQLADLLNKLTA